MLSIYALTLTYQSIYLPVLADPEGDFFYFDRDW